MKVYTYSEARQNLSELLNLSLSEPVMIKRKDGNVFTIMPMAAPSRSPFDVKGVKTRATMADIMQAIRDSREMRGAT